MGGMEVWFYERNLDRKEGSIKGGKEGKCVRKEGQRRQWRGREKELK